MALFSKFPRFSKPRWKPVSILTGFLGSGKTTILQHLLQEPGMSRTALIINEFGEISIDHLLIEKADEKMVLLSNGCVCCSVRGDLVQAILALFARQKADEIPPFDRILLETTGLADPGPIVQSLIGPALAHYPVYFDSIATTVDACNALAAMPRHPQMLSQIAVADSLIITKRDMVEPGQADFVADQVRSLNPRAQLVFSERGRVDSALVFGQKLLDPTAAPKEMRSSVTSALAQHPGARGDVSYRGKSPTGHEHGKEIQSFVIVRQAPLSFGSLQRFLRALCSYQSQDLLRVKGLVRILKSEKSPYVIHGVQGVMHPPTKLRRWPTSDHRTRLVFIAHEIQKADVENLLEGAERRFL